MKKLHYKLLGLFIILASTFTFTSCEGDKVYETYYEDTSANWDVIPFEIGGSDHRWSWNSEKGYYQCIININSKYTDVDEFIYNNGIALGYVFLGEQYVDETQSLMPFYDDVNGANLWNDTSIQGSNKDFDVCFYFQWDDKRQSPPPLYNVRLVLAWGKVK